jgi:hypothetical protein
MTKVLHLSKNCEPGRRRVSIVPRLLNKRQASIYCGVSEETFDSVCPIQPVSPWPKVCDPSEISPHRKRWDRFHLDSWIDTLTGVYTLTGVEEGLDREDHLMRAWDDERFGR